MPQVFLTWSERLLTSPSSIRARYHVRAHVHSFFFFESITSLSSIGSPPSLTNQSPPFQDAQINLRGSPRGWKVRLWCSAGYYDLAIRPKIGFNQEKRFTQIGPVPIIVRKVSIFKPRFAGKYTIDQFG